MVKAEPVCVIEVDGPHNQNLHFRPLQRAIRGRFDLSRIGEPMARMAQTRWPLPIPSQQLGIDSQGRGFLIEPLHDAEHAATREKIEKSGQRLEPARQTFDNIHLPSWAYWMQRAVESGLAKVVAGELPAVEGKPRMNFILAEPEQAPIDKLTAAMEKQAESNNRLTAAILRLLESRK